MLTHLTDLVRGSLRYATGLYGFLSETIDLDEAKAVLARELQDREETFLLVLERGIYNNPSSPYRRLLQHAGYEFSAIQTQVREQGLEATLSKLYHDGVYVTLDEFKGRAPIRRPGLEFPVTAFDFDNPLLTAHYHSRTGGSRGGGTRVAIDFNQLAHEAAGNLVGLHATGLESRPCVLLRASPPSTTGLRVLLLQARAERLPVKWFSPSKAGWNRQGLQGRALMVYTLLIGRLIGRPLARPEHILNTKQVVDYLADGVRRGTPFQVECGASEWVRICLAAEKLGANISGTAFRGGGEPYTEGKAGVLERVGASGYPSYAMQEAGGLSKACGRPMAPDDMHLMTNRVAMLQLPVSLDFGLEVQGFFHTSLTTSAPKLMLNVESGDYGVMEERACGCLWQELGFTMHVHTVRSYEKLTSGSVMFMGSMLHRLLEETLPNRFGGSPLDYQLVEEEEDGVPRVSVIVSSRVGPVSEMEVVETVLDSLGFADWSRRQADLWRQNNTLRVQRREPYATRAGKILPLHVLDAKDEVNTVPRHSSVP
jgi:hypothetical protein